VKQSLRFKISLSYVLVALISVALISILTGVFIDKPFRDYVKHNQEQNIKEVTSSISRQYKSGGDWNMNVVETIGVNALEEGLIMKVKDNSGKIIWDATIHNNGMCQRIIEQMAQNVSKR
jgi:hypothetical protein